MSNMIKILYVTTVSSTINAFLKPHIQYLVGQGYVVDIATNVTDEVDEELLGVGVKVFSVAFQRNPVSLKNLDACRQMRIIQENERYDMVHVHTPIASFVTRYALRKEKNLKVLYTCHGFHFYRGGPSISWLLFYPAEKLAARWTDGLITINSEDYAVARNFKLRAGGKICKIDGVGIEKEKYVLECFDKSGYREELGLGDDDFVILVLAELNRNKNHIQLIRAMSLLKDRYPDIKAILAGGGPLEAEIKGNIKTLGLESKVMLIGWRRDVKELINLSDVVGLFSKREGLGKCLLEAMVCGKFIMATNTRGPRELIKEGVNGVLFDVDDVEATVESIERVYVNSLFDMVSEEEIVEVTNKYLLENVLAQLRSVYEGLCIESDIDTHDGMCRK
ncbi:glycosyltransferase family 4 protein [Kistimonas asteriae]|uniref:glycosyltransferase family 4 protein n=1 Tax=Kistimonas asteriae TaxID=517724 RepID=UPI001BA8E69A|nr:glycosyltransferase family 4 protein [Kistimonas asteriae]